MEEGDPPRHGPLRDVLQDIGGGSSWGIQAESGSTYTSFGVEDRLATYARASGLPDNGGTYVFNIRDVDWARYLRVVDPCTTQRTC